MWIHRKVKKGDQLTLNYVNKGSIAFHDKMKDVHNFSCECTDDYILANEKRAEIHKNLGSHFRGEGEGVEVSNGGAQEPASQRTQGCHFQGAGSKRAPGAVANSAAASQQASITISISRPTAVSSPCSRASHTHHQPSNGSTTACTPCMASRSSSRLAVSSANAESSCTRM